MVVFKSTKKQDDDYLEFREFRFFLQALRQFFEYYQAFSNIFFIWNISNEGVKSHDSSIKCLEIITKIKS